MIKITKSNINEVGGFGRSPFKITKLEMNKLSRKEKTIGYVKTENKISIKLNETVSKKELEEIIVRLASLR